MIGVNGDRDRTDCGDRLFQLLLVADRDVDEAGDVGAGGLGFVSAIFDLTEGSVESDGV